MTQAIGIGHWLSDIDAAQKFLQYQSRYWSPRLLHSIRKPKEIYITENGCAAKDDVAPDGNIYDTERLTYRRKRPASE